MANYPFSVEGQPIIIQGGMGLYTSKGLAGPVALHEGGVGTVAISGISPEKSLRQLSLARELAGPNAIIAVNQMVADKFEVDHLTKALASGLVDLSIQGAGITRVGHKINQEFGTYTGYVISRPDQVQHMIKMYKGYVALFYYEAKENGGHIGDMYRSLKISDNTLGKIIEAAWPIPVVAGGNITPNKAEELYQRYPKLGGIVLATPFITTPQCDIPDNTKRIYLKSQQKDTTIIQSAAGLPARAIQSALTRAIRAGRVLIPEDFGMDCNEKKQGCIKSCKNRDADPPHSKSFPIREALTIATLSEKALNALEVNYDAVAEFDYEGLGKRALGLYFTGIGIGNWNEMSDVDKIMREYRSRMPDTVNGLGSMGLQAMKDNILKYQRN